MRVLKLFFGCLLWPLMAHANLAAPQLTFAQATAIVVAAKQANPSLLDLRIAQTQANVQINAIVANNQNNLQAKALGLSVLRLIKSMSLDVPVLPQNKANDLGKGLYDYTLTIAKPSAVAWLQATKKANQNMVQWQDVSPAQPATRQLLQQLQQAAKPAAALPTTPQPTAKAYEAGSAPIFGTP